MKRDHCVDCGVNIMEINEYSYMLRDELWAALGLSSGYCCIGCVELRLGRKLKKGDFADWPVTYWFQAQSDRLRRRIYGTALGTITKVLLNNEYASAFKQKGE